MTMTALYQMGILPAVLLTLAGLLVLHKQDQDKARHHFLLFLLVVNVLLLLSIFFTQSPPGAPYRPLSFELPTLLTRYVATQLEPRFGIGIVATEGGTVTVRYPHYQPTDPNCCPSLPDYVVRFRWSGTAVQPLDPLPPADQGAAG
jgi:hypothetical protein